MMNSTILKTHLPLVGLLALWLISIALVAYPDLWTSIPTFPVKISSERVIFLFASTIAAATYSGFLGVKWLKLAYS
jgi:hypothetical protein